MTAAPLRELTRQIETRYRGHRREQQPRLAEMRRLTDIPTLPEGGCRTWTACHDGRAAFVADHNKPIRLENDILFTPLEETTHHG